MPRRRRVTPFLHRRKASWYLRFKLPRSLSRLIGRAEFRVSLNTKEFVLARARAEGALPEIFWLKSLVRLMSELEPEHVQRAVNLAFSRIVAELERTKEPWMRGKAANHFGGDQQAFEPS